MSATITILATFDVTGVARRFTATVSEISVDGNPSTYVARLFDELAYDAGEDEGCQETFGSMEEAEAYIEREAERLRCAVAVSEPTVTIESALTCGRMGVGVDSEYELRCCAWVTSRGHIAHSFEVTHEWGGMEDGSVCSSCHGHLAREFDTYEEARAHYMRELGEEE